MKYALILLLFIGGCATTTQEEWQPTPLDYAVTSSLVAKYNVLPTPTTIVRELKIGPCDECNSTGVLGDGVTKIKCPRCNGKGHIDQSDIDRHNKEKDLNPDGQKPEQPAPQKEEKKELGQTLRNEIFMYTRSGCSWCTKWEREVLPKLKNQGWKITPVTDLRNGVPHFKMYISGVEKTHQGFMSVEEFTQYFNEATGRDVKKN